MSVRSGSGLCQTIARVAAYAPFVFILDSQESAPSVTIILCGTLTDDLSPPDCAAPSTDEHIVWMPNQDPWVLVMRDVAWPAGERSVSNSKSISHDGGAVGGRGATRK